MLQEASKAVRKQRWEKSLLLGGLRDNFVSEMAFELASKVRLRFAHVAMKERRPSRQRKEQEQRFSSSQRGVRVGNSHA